MIHHLILAALPLLQGGDVGVQAQFEPSAAQVGAPVELRVKLTIPPGFHLYHPDQNPDDGIPVSVAVPSGFEAAGALRSLKEPETHIDQIGKTRVEYLWLTGKSELILPLAVAEGANGSFETTIAVDVQVCDEMMCFPPDTIHANGVEFDRLPGKYTGPIVTATDAPEEEAGTGLLAFLLAAMAGGLFALMMPCTYPMIPITISFFTKQADARGGKVLPLSLAYGAGIVVIFILIGVLVGPVILAFATHPVTNLLIGALFLVFAFVLFGLLTLNPPQFLMNAAGQASSKGGYLGVFLMGATLVVTSFTCTAPFVGSLLSFGASGGDLLRVAMGMGVFGLTMAIPFVFLSLAPGRIQAMPQSGQWMDTIKVTLGFVELAAALKFISNADIIWNWQILSRETFLVLWALIFFAAALYLLGALHKKQNRPAIRGKRVLSGIIFLALSSYCAWGWTGERMDTVMTAIIPPYSSSEHLEAKHEIVVDDYEAALSKAKADGKYLLVNFTGHT